MQPARVMDYAGRMQKPILPTRFLSLVDDGEPFRILFPVGMLLGLIGILLWPAWVWKVTDVYPGLAHSRIMIQGHMTAFVIGFLGTALPRMLRVPRLRATGSIAWACGLVVASLLHGGGWQIAGDALYLITFGSFVGVIALRARQRRDLPPPAFVLTAGGVACALLGTALQIAIQTAPQSLPSLAFPLARLLLNQAFLLLPIMGVGAFILPRFLGLPSLQDFPDSYSPHPRWVRRALFAASCGFFVLVTFVLEAGGYFCWAFGLRAVAVLVFFAVEVPVFRFVAHQGSLANAVRIALWALPVGYLTMAVWPLYQTALAHIVFITGFSLVTLAVASRVLLGHSGQGRDLKKSSWQVRTLITCIILAMLTRVSADWMPDVRFTHYAYAALVWALGTSVWAVRFLPAVRIADAD